MVNLKSGIGELSRRLYDSSCGILNRYVCMANYSIQLNICNMVKWAKDQEGKRTNYLFDHFNHFSPIDPVLSTNFKE